MPLCVGFAKPPGLGADLVAYVKWKELGILGRATYVLEFPFRLARTLTIPAVFESRSQREDDGGGWAPDGSTSVSHLNVLSQQCYLHAWIPKQ